VEQMLFATRSLIMGNMFCSTEMMKDSNTIIQVVRKQKQDKLINVLRVLSMLSYFLDQVCFWSIWAYPPKLRPQNDRAMSQGRQIDDDHPPSPRNTAWVMSLYARARLYTTDCLDTFSLLQIEFLKKISDNGGDVSDEGAISDERWNQLVAATDPKVIHFVTCQLCFASIVHLPTTRRCANQFDINALHWLWRLQVIEDLEALFNAFDDDHSGELDEEEVGLLVSQMGTKLSQEENHNLFRIMDADGGGTVSFREFATVVLHQKNSSRSVPFTCPQIYGIPMPMSRMPQALLV